MSTDISHMKAHLEPPHIQNAISTPVPLQAIFPAGPGGAPQSRGGEKGGSCVRPSTGPSRCVRVHASRTESHDARGGFLLESKDGMTSIGSGTGNGVWSIRLIQFLFIVVRPSVPMEKPIRSFWSSQEICMVLPLSPVVGRGEPFTKG